MLRNVALVAARLAVSRKITDSPGAIVVMPFSATAAAAEPELSSIFQPVMSIAKPVVLVTSNQSAATGLLPLDQGATSETNSLPAVPGEPISAASFAATNAPFSPAALALEIRAPFRPAALLNVVNVPVGEAPNDTLACTTPAALNRLTWSPAVLSPTPVPV